jgi:hypothetical protein
VERDRSPDRLALAGHLLGLAATRLEALTAGADHPRLSEARDRLRAARSQLVRAGGLGRDGRLWLSVLLLGVAIWAMAVVLHDLLGLPGGWTAAITLPVVLLGIPAPVSRLLNAVDRWLGRARSARLRTAALTPPAGVGPAGETPALLRLARRELTTLLRERAGVRPTAGDFDRRRWRDLRMAALSAADRDVCVVIHAVEIWLRVADRAEGADER